MLHGQIRADMIAALKAKDDVTLRTLRGLLTAFVNELVATNRKPDGELSDEDAVRVLMRSAKQRKDSIEQFEKGGRQDLADSERAERAVIEQYMPRMMSKDEIRKVSEAKKDVLGINNSSQKGQLMGAVMKELKGKADGTDVKEVVDLLF